MGVDSCQPCKRLRLSRLHELQESNLSFCFAYLIYPFWTDIVFAHVNGSVRSAWAFICQLPALCPPLRPRPWTGGQTFEMVCVFFGALLVFQNKWRDTDAEKSMTNSCRCTVWDPFCDNCLTPERKRMKFWEYASLQNLRTGYRARTKFNITSQQQVF